MGTVSDLLEVVARCPGDTSDRTPYRLVVHHADDRDPGDRTVEENPFGPDPACARHLPGFRPAPQRELADLRVGRECRPHPLFSVLLGVIFLRERLRPSQWIPVGLATLGVIYLTWTYGSLPWIALSLAFTFGFYGLVKKTAPLGSLYGLTLETGLVFLPALGYLIFAEGTGQGAFGHSGSVSALLMVGSGVVTIIPLLMFASAARRIPLTMIGIMQYVAPTLQFLIGVLIYKEPFASAQMIGFSMVWIALIVFWMEGVIAHRAQRAIVETA
jgi:uncharacterized membrane protein